MATVNGLQGGLGNGRDNGAVLEEARKRLTAEKVVDIQRLLKRQSEKKEEGQRMSSEELSSYVNDLANGAFEFVIKGRNFLRQLDKDVTTIGAEVKYDLCEDGDDTREARALEYESTIPILTDYGPSNDRILREEAEVVGRRQFIEALCLRVRTRAQIGLLVDNLRNAEDKDCLEFMLEKSTSNDKNVFVKSFAKNAPIRAFGKGYGIANVFGEQHHEFASKKLTEAVNARVKELTTAYMAEVKKRKQKVFVDEVNLTSAEDLLFGENNGTAVLPWNFQGCGNVVKIRREGARLYIVDAVGSPLFDLEKMREECKDPFVILRHILSPDGKHLCVGQMTEGGRARYSFTEIVARTAFPMTLWVRTAAGANCPNRLLPEDETRTMFTDTANGKKSNGNSNNGDKKYPVKTGDDRLTDEEFLFFHGLGEYELIFKAGFHYEPRDENEEPTDTTFQITTTAIAMVERKNVDGKNKIALKSVSTDELRQLLLAGGAEEGHEFFEGQKGAGLPVPLRLGISQAFKRLKLNEE